MVFLGALVAVLLLSCAEASNNSLSSAWVFVNDVAWETPPAELHKSYIEGDGEIMVFFPSGQFAYLSATLFRDVSSGAITVCGGCGYSTKRGSWRREQTNLRVQAHWTHRHFRSVEEPGAPERETESLCRVTSEHPDSAPRDLDCDGQRFGPLGHVSNPETINLLIKKNEGE